MGSGDPCLCAGEGSERAKLTALIERLGLTGRVFLPGFVEGLEEVIERADLLLLTSRYEGRPNVVIEALSTGTPVVATESSVAMRELLVDPGSGRLLESREAKAVALGIEAVLASPRPAPIRWPARRPISIPSARRSTNGMGRRRNGFSNLVGYEGGTI